MSKTKRGPKKGKKRGPYKKRKPEAKAQTVVKQGFIHLSKKETEDIWNQFSRRKPETTRILDTQIKPLKIGESVYIPKSAWPAKSLPRDVAARTYTEHKYDAVTQEKGQFVRRIK